MELCEAVLVAKVGRGIVSNRSDRCSCNAIIVMTERMAGANTQQIFDKGRDRNFFYILIYISFEGHHSIQRRNQPD